MALATTAAGADAPAPSDSDALIAEGVELRQQGHDEEALALFRRAEAIRVTPRSRAQVGLASEALELWVDAEKALRDALSGAGDPWIDRYRSVLEQALETAQRRLGWLDVAADAPGAELWLDGARVGLFPLPIVRAPVGSVGLEIRAPGYAPLLRRVEVHAGEFTRQSFVLARLPATALPFLVEQSEPPPDTSAPRTGAWLTAAGSALFLAGGIAAQVWREDQASYWNSSACEKVGQTREDQCGPYRSNANIGTALAATGYALSAGLAITSVYLFVRSRGEEAAARGPTAMAPGCAVGVGALGCTIHF